MNRFVDIAFGLKPDIWGTVMGMVLMTAALVAIPFLDRGGPLEPQNWGEALSLRLRGWAYVQLKDMEGAREAFDESLRLARIEGENVGMRSADYEIALTLDALGHLGDLVGDPTVDLERERARRVEGPAHALLTPPPRPGDRRADNVVIAWSTAR